MVGKRFTRRRVVALAAGIVLLCAIAGAAGYRVYKTAHAPKPDGVVTLEFAPADLTHLEARPLARWLPVSGALQPVSLATVKAKVPGDVVALTVREGQTVRAGEVLARIDSADLNAKLADRVGALDAARAQLALADKTRQTNLALVKQNFISQNAFDNSESSYNVARAGVQSAQAQVDMAKNALRDAVAIAPISGVVAKRHVQPGEKVAFDSPMITIMDLRNLELQAMVPAGDVPELGVGMPVELTIDGFDRRFSGRIERINPSTETGTRAIIVYVGLPNPDSTLRAGMFATGRIALAATAAVPSLPVTAVRTEAGQSFVWVIVGGKLLRRAVVTGRRDDESGVVEVKTALESTPVLAGRFDNLKEGAPALVRAAGPATAKAD